MLLIAPAVKYKV